MVVAELMGTAVLAIAVYSMVARTTFPLFAALAAGLTAGLLVHTVGAVSGAHSNPAITLGLWSIRKIKTGQAIAYLAAQMLGGVAAWALIKYFLGHGLDSLAVGKFEWKVLISEGVGALVFGFGVASAVYQKYEGGRLSFAIGASLTIGVLVASLAANGVVNPAVAVGIQSWSWAYAVGPLVGSVLGMNLYLALFAPASDLPRPGLRVSVTSSRRAVAPKRKVPAKRKR